jgi:D-alanine transaminase
MARIVYLNGEFIQHHQAKVSIFDRGFLFADAVYEVTSVLNEKLIDFDGHAVRLARSLKEINIDFPCERGVLLEIHRELIRLNGLTNGLIYLQVTRGNPEDRDFIYPSSETPPTLILFTQSKPDLVENPLAKRGLKVMSVPDRRWGRRDIKTVQLLYSSMSKMEARSAGYDDAWMVENDEVTEGTSSNAYIIKGQKIITRNLSPQILQGITRAAVLRFASEFELEIEERPFTLAEAQHADEAFITSASSFVTPVVELDGHAIGSGRPGPIVGRLREIYLDESLKTAI